MLLTRKIQLIPVGDKEEINRVYKFIRDGQYAQYQACNLLMGQLASEYYNHEKDIKNEKFKARKKEILLNSNPIFEGIEFSKGVDTLSAVTQKVNKDFNTAIKNGLARGERSVTNYKRTNPLITRGRDLKFCHKYDNYNEFLDHLYDSSPEIYIKWVNKIVFKVVLGNPYKSASLRSEIQQIFEENYKIGGSSIQIDENKIILNLSMEIPKKDNVELDENTVVGVDLGIAIPAMCALNNNLYKRCRVGSKEDFLRMRTQLQAQRKRLQKSLYSTSGGHGRKKKLKALEKFRKRERNFVQTYNHVISKRVVDFALKEHAKYINLEDLTGYDTSKFILRNWSYYELQQYITYKANKHGIVVRKINPCYTSQVCSVCGNWEEGQRTDQATFVCKNEDCDSKKKYEFLNADFNAARNIAKSTLFSTGKKKNETDKKYVERIKKEAREYYGIIKEDNEED